MKKIYLLTVATLIVMTSGFAAASTNSADCPLKQKESRNDFKKIKYDAKNLLASSSNLRSRPSLICGKNSNSPFCKQTR